MAKKNPVTTNGTTVKAGTSTGPDDSKFAHLKDPANPDYDLAMYNTLMTAELTVGDLNGIYPVMP